MDKAMIVAGIGCRKGVSEKAVLAAIDGALSHHGLSAAKLDVLATGPLKRDEPALHAVARRLGLNLVVVTDAALRETGTLSMSEASLAATGTASASEAAALAAAGHGSRLLGPRVAVGPVTCAIAVGTDRNSGRKTGSHFSWNCARGDAQ